MENFFPTWQILLAIYGLTYFLRHKCTFLMGRLQLLDRLLECDFCLGGHGGWIAWLTYVGMLGTWPMSTFWSNILSFLLWVFIGAGGVCLLSALVKYFEDSIRGPK